MDKKSIFVSKTFWVNILAVIAMTLQGVTGSDSLLSPEVQAAVLALVNIGLRTITKKSITWE